MCGKADGAVVAACVVCAFRNVFSALVDAEELQILCHELPVEDSCASLLYSVLLSFDVA